MDYPTEDPVDRLSAFHKGQENSRYRPGVDSPGSSIFDLPVHSDETLKSDPSLSNSVNKSISVLPQVNQTFLVISGGTGCNSICSAFGDASYILPVSDDGGSSSEIIRVIGGPSIGDVRSRLIRLIPSSAPNSPLDRIRNLLSYRLSPDNSEREARDEWRDIIEGRSPIWNGIPPDRKEVIRGFLVHFEGEVLRRAQKNFSFRNGSIGNYFLAAARIFFRSLPSAIFLFSSITNSQANIVPVLVTNHTVTIAVELESGRTIVGQCNISHPVQSQTSFSFSITPSSPVDEAVEGQSNFDNDDIMPQNLTFNKSNEGKEDPLESRISRLYYINAYGHEIHPNPNPDFLSQCSERSFLVYSCGSLWTSIIPCLALKGVASAIAGSKTLKAKVILLNSRNDRETGGYTAVDYIRAITRTLNTPYGMSSTYTTYPVSAYVTHLVHLEGGSVPINIEDISGMGIQCVGVQASAHDKYGPIFDAVCVQEALRIISMGLRGGKQNE